MPDRRSWRSLIPGTIAFVALVAVAFVVLKFARVGALHGDTFSLYAAAAEARGVLPGTDVWLNGKKIGRVRDVAFAPTSSDTTSRVVMALDILASAGDQVRRDARIQVKSGGSLLGAPVVTVEGGTILVPAVAHGDTLHAAPQGDLESMGSRFSEAQDQLPKLMANVKLLSKDVSAAWGLIGNVAPTAEVEHAQRVLAHASEVASKLTGSGLPEGSPTVMGAMARARQVMARSDSLRLLVSGSSGSLGRFRRDSTLLRTVSDVRDEASILRMRLQLAQGTAGRMMADSALARSMAQVEREMGALMADIKRRPLRYLSF